MNARAFYMAVAGSICLLVGWMFTYFGLDNLHQAQHSSAKPVETTAAQLRFYRPGSNLHITLTEFEPYPEGMAVY